jgi:hypothetical protein
MCNSLILSASSDLQRRIAMKFIEAKEQLACDFCGLPHSKCGPLVVGGPKHKKVHICGDCCVRGISYLEARQMQRQAENSSGKALLRLSPDTTVADRKAVHHDERNENRR